MRAITLLTVFAAVGAMGQTSKDTVSSVKHPVTIGDKKTWNMTLELDNGQGLMTVTAKIALKATAKKELATAMAADFTELKMSRDGQEQDIHDLPDTINFDMQADGRFVDLKSEATAEPGFFSRLFVSWLSVPINEAGVKPGDKWKQQWPKDGPEPFVGQATEYEFLEVVSFKEIPVLKIAFSQHAETGGQTMYNVKGTIFVDPKSGDVLKLTGKVTDLTVGGDQPASASVVLEKVGK